MSDTEFKKGINFIAVSTEKAAADPSSTLCVNNK